LQGVARGPATTSGEAGGRERPANEAIWAHGVLRGGEGCRVAQHSRGEIPLPPSFWTAPKIRGDSLGLGPPSFVSFVCFVGEEISRGGGEGRGVFPKNLEPGYVRAPGPSFGVRGGQGGVGPVTGGLGIVTLRVLRRLPRVALEACSARPIPLPLSLPLRGVIRGDCAAFSPVAHEAQSGENAEKSRDLEW
jgi:hypothetical protein